MTLAIYPSFPGLTWSIPKYPEFNTIVQDSPNLMDTRISLARNPRWHWELTYEVLRQNATYSEYTSLQGFLLSLQGQGGDFLYPDPSDSSVGPAVTTGVTPNPNAELQVVTDGTNYFSPIQRDLGGFFEDISDLNGSIAVYVAGVLATVGTSAGQYQVQGPGLAVSGSSFLGMYLAWGGAVAPSGIVSAQFNFYHRCRMEEDETQFEQFLSSMWTVGGAESKSSGALKFCTSRIAQV